MTLRLSGKIQVGGAKMTYVRTAIWSLFAIVWIADCTTLIGQTPDGTLYLRNGFQFTQSMGHLVLPPLRQPNPPPGRRRHDS